MKPSAATSASLGAEAKEPNRSCIGILQGLGTPGSVVRGVLVVVMGFTTGS